MEPFANYLQEEYCWNTTKMKKISTALPPLQESVTVCFVDPKAGGFEKKQFNKKSYPLSNFNFISW